MRDDAPGAGRFNGAVAAIGNFDGVHRGHRAVIDAAVARAAALGAPAVAVTFEPHPRKVLRPFDPIFRLTFPQPGMLAAADLAEVTDLLRREAPAAQVRQAVREIRMRLNPHPSGQLNLNTPRHEGRPLPQEVEPPAGLLQRVARSLVCVERVLHPGRVISPG